MFSDVLSSEDAVRASEVIEKLVASGFHDGALTGGLAIEAHLRAAGRSWQRRRLNDLDFVVELGQIAGSLADRFLLNHIHPHAPEGKTLLQLIDRDQALRVDLFRAFGSTLSRARRLDEQTGPLLVVGIEDLVARTTSHVCGRLREGRPIDPKHVRAFTRLDGLGDHERLDEAWRDHRQNVPGTYDEAALEARELLSRRLDLLVVEEYSTVVRACEQCQNFGPFRLAEPDLIVSVLGYW